MSDPHTLRIWLAGPLQSWGASSRFESRSTELVPTKSGVIGLLCAALGRSRQEPVDDLAALRFGVCIEQAGSVLRDFHTVGAGTDLVAVASGGRGRGIVTERFYLEDAVFVAGLEASERGPVEQLRDALLAPRWLLALGRRSCPPAGPLVDADSVFTGGLEAAFADHWVPRGVRAVPASSTDVRALVESDDGAIVLDDQPVGAAYACRSFRPRRSALVRIRRGVA